jgi:hypothetical protein
MNEQKKNRLKCCGALIEDHFNLPLCFQFRELELSTCKSYDNLLHLVMPDLTLFWPGTRMRPRWRDAAASQRSVTDTHNLAEKCDV